jgi:DNA-binding XRE family transcriptional regulator
MGSLNSHQEVEVANGLPRQQPKFDMATNLRMKAARVLRGLTQLQLADQVGSKEIDISRLETGRARPEAEMKRRIAEILQKPPYEIFDC